jgi:transcriptional regulator with XRE-family HTH domain
MKKNTILHKIAKRVRNLRKINKISQEELAEKADLHPTFIGNIERAETNPTTTTLEKIAKAFNITLAELLTFPEERKSANTSADTLNKALKLLDMAKELAKDEVDK